MTLLWPSLRKKFSSCVMMMSWKFACFLRSSMILEATEDGVQQNKSGTHSMRLAARASMFSVSRAFVGSSSAKMPQF